MASKRKLSDQALEDKVFKIRKIDNKGTVCSKEYSIIWKILENSHDGIKSFVTDGNSNPSIKLDDENAHDITFKCYLKNGFLKDYYKIVLQLTLSSYKTVFPYNLPENMSILLSLIDKNKYIRNTHKKVIKTIKEEISEIEFSNFIKKADIDDKNNSFFSNEELMIYCKIYYGEERNATEEILLNDDIPANCQLKVLDNFKELIESERFSDMKFIIDNKELKVHKNILSAQSPVFKSIIESNTTEEKDNIIEINDVSYETMKEVLRFIYAGDIKNVKTMAKDIFVAAEKYKISGLKTICENELIASLNIKNISDMLKLVDQYDSKNLKKRVLNFIFYEAKVNNSEKFQKTLDTLSNNLLKEIINKVMSSE